MSNDRLAAMRQFAEKQPGNPFPRYALAMELKSAGLPDESIVALEALRRLHPAYVATYLQLGMLLEDAGRDDEAREAYSVGVDHARAAGNAHALGELQGRLSALHP